MSLQQATIPSFKCEACTRTGAQQQTVLGDLPPFLIVHINKPGPTAALSAENAIRLSGTDLQRIAVVHHTGETAKSGHYTATVGTQTSAFHCNDYTITPQPYLFDQVWPNAYMIFYDTRSPHVFDWRGNSHPAPSSVLSNDSEKKENEAAIVSNECGDRHSAPREEDSDHEDDDDTLRDEEATHGASDDDEHPLSDEAEGDDENCQFEA